jgi:hypothetical protein
MGLQNEGKPSTIKPHGHPHYEERFQGRKQDQHQHYQGIRWNNQIYSWNRESHNHYLTKYYKRPASTTNWRSHNDNT